MIKKGKQVGLFIDMYLKPQARILPNEDIHMIFSFNERTIMNMVPTKLEGQVLGGQENQAWNTRPESFLPCLESKLASVVEDPNKVSEILDEIGER